MLIKEEKAMLQNLLSNDKSKKDLYDRLTLHSASNKKRMFLHSYIIIPRYNSIIVRVH